MPKRGEMPGKAGLAEKTLVRKARIADVPAIQALVNEYAKAGEMLGRPRAEIYEHLRDFTVAERDGRVVGCVALHIDWADIAEVRSLAVAPALAGRGLGRTLTGACLAEARELGIPRVYALTYKAGFFERLGFSKVEKESLPHKVWGDCLKCPKYPECDEDALVINLATISPHLPA
jgi:amino-acid N-acetyltransferase